MPGETVPFVVLTSGRTGSTYVRLWLNSHPLIRCHGEVFLRDYGAMDGFMHYCRANPAGRLVFALFGHRRLSRRRWNIPLRSLTRGFLRSLFRDPDHSAPWTDMETWNDYQPRTEEPPAAAVGFKLGYTHLRDFSYLGDWLEGEPVRVVHLVRMDTLAQHVSRRTAVARGRFHSTDRLERVTVRLDPEETLMRLRRIDDARIAMRRRFEGGRYHEISYEGFFGEDADRTREDLLRFLGLEPADVEPPPLLRMNRSPLREIIENYDEVAEALEGTRFQR